MKVNIRNTTTNAELFYQICIRFPYYAKKTYFKKFKFLTLRFVKNYD